MSFELSTSTHELSSLVCHITLLYTEPGWVGWGAALSPRVCTLIFSYIRRLRPFLGVQNLEFQYFGGFSEKVIFWGGIKVLWRFFYGFLTKLTSFRGHFYAF